MKKLFLTSAASEVLDIFPKEFDVTPQKSTVVFIPTAAENYQDKWFVDTDREKLVEVGFKVIELDIKGKNTQEIYEVLNKADIIFVAGGNTFYLLQEAKRSGFDKLVLKLVNNGIIYIGSSAGSLLAGPDIQLVKTLDDPIEAPELNSYKGIGLVDFVVIPHVGSVKYDQKIQSIIKNNPNYKHEIILISDDQAVKVVGKEYNVVSQ